MKKFLFSCVIKEVGKERYSIKPYAMREVRGEGAALTVKHRSSFHSFESQEKVEQLLKEIEERERYLKQVADKTHHVEKEAYEKGFVQGEKAGRELGEKRFEAVIKSFSGALEEIGKLRERIYQDSEQEMVALVLAIARKVIQREVASDRTIFLQVVRSALEYMSDRERLRVRCNPFDLEWALQYKGELMGEMKGVLFEGDEKVQRGDVVIESTRGVVESGIEHCLRKIENLLKELAGGNSPAEKETHRGASEDGERQT